MEEKINEKVDLLKSFLKLFWEKSERTSEEIQELLNIDKRTLRKLISLLRKKGFKIRYDRKLKAYKFEEYSRSRLVALLGLSFLYRKIPDKDLKRELMNYIITEFSLEPFTLLEIENFGDFRDYLFMTVEGIDLNLFWKLQEAIRESKELRIVYKELPDAPSQWYIVRPIYLASLKGYWYLISYEPEEGGVKLYRLDGIESAFYTGRSFQISEDFFLEDYLPMLAFYVKPHKKHKVKVVFDKGMEWVKDRVWHPTQEVRVLPDGRLEITMTVANLEEFFSWLASFGYRAKLVSPKALVEQYKSFLGLILNIYDEKTKLQDETLTQKLEDLSEEDREALKELIMETLKGEDSSENSGEMDRS